MTISVNMKVAEKIAELCPEVEDKVVGTLVGRELDRRSNALTKAVDDWNILDKEMKKMDKPDVNHYDEKGQVVASYYSKERTEQIAKQKKKIEKHTNAINKALKGDFGDVFQLGKPEKEDSGKDE